MKLFAYSTKKVIVSLTVPGLEGTMLDLKSCIPYSEGLKMLIVRLRNN